MVLANGYVERVKEDKIGMSARLDELIRNLIPDSNFSEPSKRVMLCWNLDQLGDLRDLPNGPFVLRQWDNEDMKLHSSISDVSLTVAPDH